jgi:hypothetical protein
VIPVLVAAVLGVRMHVLWPRALAFASWGPLLAVAAVVDVSLHRWLPSGLAVLALAAFVVLPSTAHSLRTSQGAAPVSSAQMHVLDRVVQPGDTVRGSWRLEQAVNWTFGRTPGPESVPSHKPVIPYAFVPRPAHATGRTWIVDSPSDPIDAPGVPCAAPRRLPDGSRISCVQRSV